MGGPQDPKHRFVRASLPAPASRAPTPASALKPADPNAQIIAAFDQAARESQHKVVEISKDFHYKVMRGVQPRLDRLEQAANALEPAYPRDSADDAGRKEERIFGLIEFYQDLVAYFHNSIKSISNLNKPVMHVENLSIADVKPKALLSEQKTGGTSKLRIETVDGEIVKCSDGLRYHVRPEGSGITLYMALREDDPIKDFYLEQLAKAAGTTEEHLKGLLLAVLERDQKFIMEKLDVIEWRVLSSMNSAAGRISVSEETVSLIKRAVAWAKGEEGAGPVGDFSPQDKMVIRLSRLVAAELREKHGRLALALGKANPLDFDKDTVESIAKSAEGLFEAVDFIIRARDVDDLGVADTFGLGSAERRDLLGLLQQAVAFHIASPVGLIVNVRAMPQANTISPQQYKALENAVDYIQRSVEALEVLERYAITEIHGMEMLELEVKQRKSATV